MLVLAFDVQKFVIGLLVVGFVIISVMMMLVVLIQRPTGGGLSGAFGSASEGAGQTAFGARTGDALTTATIVIFLLFLGFAIGLNYVVEKPSAAPALATPVPTAPGGAGDGTEGGAGTPGEGVFRGAGSEDAGTDESGTGPEGGTAPEGTGEPSAPAENSGDGGE